MESTTSMLPQSVLLQRNQLVDIKFPSNRYHKNGVYKIIKTESKSGKYWVQRLSNPQEITIAQRSYIKDFISGAAVAS
tara:strand:- start:343 stop:576 length:234 start_codon:yes stop_codon:yes gene_type:complete